MLVSVSVSLSAAYVCVLADTCWCRVDSIGELVGAQRNVESGVQVVVEMKSELGGAKFTPPIYTPCPIERQH